MGGNGGAGSDIDGGGDGYQSQIPEIDEPKPDESEKPKEPKENTPCNEMEKLTENAELKQILEALEEYAEKNNEEYGILVSEQDDGTFGYDLLRDIGIEGKCEMKPFGLNGPLHGFIHTHFSGCQSIFSVSDIRAMYQLCENGLILNHQTFFFSVVTATGSYMIMIDDIEKFDAFGQTFLTGDNSMLEDMFYYRGITPENSIGLNEQNFLMMMNANGGSGLKLFRAEKGSQETYTPKGLDKNNNVIQKDCL